MYSYDYMNITPRDNITQHTYKIIIFIVPVGSFSYNTVLYYIHDLARRNISIQHSFEHVIRPAKT